jgi:hypothetical protein
VHAGLCNAFQSFLVSNFDVLLSHEDLLLISVGPTVQFSSVHRFAASSHLAGPPTLISVGPTVQFSTPLRGLFTSGRSPHAY